MQTFDQRYLIAFSHKLLSWHIYQVHTNKVHRTAYRHGSDAQAVAAKMNAGLVKFEPHTQESLARNSNYAKEPTA